MKLRARAGHRIPATHYMKYAFLFGLTPPFSITAKFYFNDVIEGGVKTKNLFKFRPIIKTTKKSMKLQKITIENFRSIEKQTFEINKINNSFTFALIGINESGKSSFLKAISLLDAAKEDDKIIAYPQDFFDDTKPIVITFEYRLEDEEKTDLVNELKEKELDEKIISQIKTEEILIRAYFDPTPKPKKRLEETPYFKKDIFTQYTLVGDKVIEKTKIETTDATAKEDFDLKKFFKTNFSDYFYGFSQNITFWESNPKYLISEQINLENFANDPKNISVPLKNCFALCGITDIGKEISKIKTNPADTNNLQEKLGDKVTEHIKNVWPDHPIKIKFQISNMMLSFLVEDEGVKYKTKTTNQRSDGFRQFISFLLTVSAQNNAGQLENSVLLLDEPETHLHPSAQENLKDELIKITKNETNNIVFFATHSNYMIDKDNIDRSFRVVKKDNHKTILEKIKKQTSSYSEVNFEVFDITTNDYHNELYGYLEDLFPEKLEKLSKDKDWYNTKISKTEKVSLPKYIRNAIHHPENTKNKKFTTLELNKSIKILRSLKYGD